MGASTSTGSTRCSSRGPIFFEGTLAQWVGRLHRVREGKSEIVVMDYVDLAIPMLDRE